MPGEAPRADSDGMNETLVLDPHLDRETVHLPEELLARFPDYEITGPGEYVRSNLVRGYDRLPMRTG